MKFATCLNCMDGRVRLPVIHWIKENYSVDYVDMITEAGMDGILAGESYKDMDGLLKKIDISLKKHIHIAVEKVKKSRPSAHIIGLWVSKEGRVEKITEKTNKE